MQADWLYTIVCFFAVYDVYKKSRGGICDGKPIEAKAPRRKSGEELDGSVYAVIGPIYREPRNICEADIACRWWAI